MTRLLLAVFALLACSCATSADSGADLGDTGAAADTDTGPDADSDTELTCDTLNSGTNWGWSGDCPRMRTPCDIVVTECSFTIDYEADGGMTMGMPYAGTIAGDEVVFEDGDTVSGCTGMLLAADTIEGSCDDGCTFSLMR